MPLQPCCLSRSQESDGGLHWLLSISALALKLPFSSPIHSQGLLISVSAGHLHAQTPLCSYPSPPACPCWKDTSGKSIPQAPRDTSSFLLSIGPWNLILHTGLVGIHHPSHSVMGQGSRETGNGMDVIRASQAAAQSKVLVWFQCR